MALSCKFDFFKWFILLITGMILFLLSNCIVTKEQKVKESKPLLGDLIIDSSQVIIPDVVIPKDSSFWYYRYYGNQWFTFYNDLYNLTIQDYGDSVDIQFEIFEDELDSLVVNKNEDKKYDGFTLYVVFIVGLFFGFIAGLFLYTIKCKL